ncbi:hypothetical protein H1231_26875, partial [Klebsiella pneumoniae]|nr:hypothetical protein [Klebsiella pneumoniae]
QGWDKHFQANTVRNRNVLSTVRLGMEVLRHSGYTITREDLLVAATLLAQNLFTHGYALGKLLWADKIVGNWEGWKWSF